MAADSLALPKPVTKTGSTFLNCPFSKLIAERSADLAELKVELNAASKDHTHMLDDIALVRYLCGFGSVKNTCSAILAAQQLKKTKAEILNAADAGQPCPGTQKIEPYSKFHMWSADERMLFVVPVAQTDFKQLLKSASSEDIVNYSLHTARRLWCWVDRISRETGRIMKYEVVCDFSGFSFLTVPPRAYVKAMSQMSEMSEVLHPLSMGSTTVTGLPGAHLARRLSRMFRPFLPKSMAETQICCGDRRKQSPASCPYLQRHFADDIQSLSSLLSGTCPVTGRAADIEPNWTEKEFVDFEANVAAIDPDRIDAKPTISL
ncbi:Catsper1 [Symbiodinium pilosum]|uniref:Catsper1 protein n=1 Tax=Symbiodinium pilosum TaxID=2952 RepID=A0A812P9F9_SYMPI|nr:Catsper1 [Symbiodinium pilosum]